MGANSSVISLIPHVKREKPIKTKAQLFAVLEEFEHPTDNPVKKKAYSLAMDDVFDALRNCACFKED